MASLAQSISITNLPALPNINTNNIVNVTNFSIGGTNYSAKGDNSTTNTTVIQYAINYASTNWGTNGATVLFPAGTYLSGTLYLTNKINLLIATNATLKMLPFVTYTNLYSVSNTFITGTNISDIEISGSGTLDGQGSPWWDAYNSGAISTRPTFINLGGCHRILIQDVKMQNPPTFHMMLKGNNTDITIQRITIDTPVSPNTDGMDLGSSNVLVQNCYISDGDDNIEIGGGGDFVTTSVVVTNCTFGIGHGVSIGSKCSGGVSNVTVVDCTFNNTDYGIRMKSDYDRGGIVQNLTYCNLGMTNITFAPIVIHSYYNSYGPPTTAGITPTTASQMAVQSTNTTPKFQNIIISNLTATAAQPGMIWARTEWPATNIILSKLNITASGSYQNFEIYNAKQVQIVDSQFTLTASKYTNFWLFNADVTFSNTTLSTTPISLYGITTSSYGNSLAFYNSSANVSDTNTLGTGPLTLADSILTISNNFTLFPTTVLNYTLDPNTNRVVVVGNLGLGGTNNIASGPGFGAGTYTLLTYTGTLSGSVPTLGSTPSGYTNTFDTSTAHKVNLIVSALTPSAPTNFTATGTNLLINLRWNAVLGATNYNLKRGTINGGPYPTVYSRSVATNYSDAAVTNAVPYYYVVTAVSSNGESTNSLQVSATPLPSAVATNIIWQVSSGQVLLSWPQDHLGWRLQIQTNNLNSGLKTNWVDVPNSTNFNQFSLPINLNNGCVFLRLVYP
jgi:polygalacturonase